MRELFRKHREAVDAGEVKVARGLKFVDMAEDVSIHAARGEARYFLDVDIANGILMVAAIGSDDEILDRVARAENVLRPRVRDAVGSGDVEAMDAPSEAESSGESLPAAERIKAPTSTRSQELLDWLNLYTRGSTITPMHALQMHDLITICVPGGIKSIERFRDDQAWGEVTGEPDVATPTTIDLDDYEVDDPGMRVRALPEESVQRALRSQFAADEAPVPCCAPHGTPLVGNVECGLCKLDEQAGCDHAAGICSMSDDGRVPSDAEVDAVMRAGVCDNVDLVGKLVLYETDGRGGKRYTLPAVVSCVQRSHPDLPLLRSAQEAGLVEDARMSGRRGQTVCGRRGIVPTNDDGFWIPFGGYPVDNVQANPVPVPLDGTAHLNVLTPGPQVAYVEHSVPYDPTGAPRTWRHHPDTIPF